MAKLIISEQKIEDAVVLNLDGDLVFGEEVRELRRKVRNLIHEGNKNLVLDMENVRYLDSSGIGEMISALTAISREDGHLKLRNPSERAHKLLAISSLLDIFEIQTGDQAAGV